VNIAAVAGRDCLHVFAFRDFLVRQAPEPVLQTIIQHELIHCFCEKDNQPKKIEEWLFRRPDFAPKRDLIGEGIHQGKAQAKRVIQYHFEENLVFEINRQWGGDEVGARNWIQANQ
jgi:hypothetical protein